jgi:hypothetical protein
MSKEILEAVSGLGATILEQKAANKTAMDEVKAALESKLADARKELADLSKKHEDEVKTLNEDLAKKGATLEEIRTKVLNMEKKGGRFGDAGKLEKKAAEIIADAFEENFAKISGVGGDVKPRLEIKAAANMTASANLTGNVVATYDLAPAVRGRRKINFRDLVPVINSSTGVWKFLPGKYSCWSGIACDADDSCSPEESTGLRADRSNRYRRLSRRFCSLRKADGSGSPVPAELHCERVGGGLQAYGVWNIPAIALHGSSRQHGE